MVHVVISDLVFLSAEQGTGADKVRKRQTHAHVWGPHASGSISHCPHLDVGVVWALFTIVLPFVHTACFLGNTISPELCCHVVCALHRTDN